MAVGVLVEGLLHSAMTQGKGGGDGKPENMKDWLRNQLKTLVSLLGKLEAKSAEALPGITGAIISWILNRVKEVVV